MTLWVKLRSHPSEYLSKIFQINDTEFIIIPQNGNKAIADGIYKYNVIYNDWIKVINYARKFETTCHSTAFDAANNKIYVINQQKKLLAVDLNTSQITKLHKSVLFGIHSNIIYANNNLHLINGDNHYIFNKIKSKFQRKYTLNDTSRNRSMESVLFLKARNILLIIGKKIHEFSFENNKWSIWDDLTNQQQLGCTAVVTRDEKYLILIGGSDVSYKGSDNIGIIDIEKQQYRKSQMKCPKSKKFQAILVGNDGYRKELLVIGYMKNCHKGTLANDILKLLMQWTCLEELHIIATTRFSQGEHWKIDLDEILR